MSVTAKPLRDGKIVVMTGESKTASAGRIGQLAFMVAVTSVLLAFAFRSASGPSGFAAATVYAFAAGFGLEFVSSVWTGRTGTRHNSRAGSGRW